MAVTTEAATHHTKVPITASTNPAMADTVHASYSITLPPRAMQPAGLDTHAEHYAALNLPVSQNRGAPLSSMAYQSEYLAALADAVDRLKASLMADMSAWKDSVCKFEDTEAKRGQSAASESTPAWSGGNDDDDDERDSSEKDEDEVD